MCIGVRNCRIISLGTKGTKSGLIYVHTWQTYTDTVAQTELRTEVCRFTISAGVSQNYLSISLRFEYSGISCEYEHKDVGKAFIYIKVDKNAQCYNEAPIKHLYSIVTMTTLISSMSNDKNCVWQNLPRVYDSV